MCSTPPPIDDVVDAGGDQRGGEVDRLLGGAALAVDGGRRGLDRQPGLEPGVAADVDRLLAELLHAAGDDVLDLGGIDPGAVDQLRVGPARAGSRGGRPCSSPSPDDRGRPASAPPRRSLPRALRTSRCRPLRLRSSVVSFLMRLLRLILRRRPTSSRVIVTRRMGGSAGYERPGVAGSGHDRLRARRLRDARPATVRLLARSDASAWRAEEDAQARGAQARRRRARADQGDHEPGRPRRLRPRRRGDRRGRATPRSSCSRARRGGAGGRPRDHDLVAVDRRARASAAAAPERFFGLHVFNPVARWSWSSSACRTALAERRRRARPRLVRGARQDRDRGPRPGRLRRQPAALPATCSRPCA